MFQWSRWYVFRCILLYTLTMQCLWPGRGGWEFINSHGAGTNLSTPLITGRGLGTETYGVGDVCLPDDLWFGSDTYTTCALVCNLHLEVWLKCAFWILMSNWWGKGWPVVTCSFQAVVVLFQMLAIFTYRQVSNIRRTLVGNKIVDNSDVVGASPVGAAPTTSELST